MRIFKNIFRYEKCRKACKYRLYRHIRTFKEIIKKYSLISVKSIATFLFEIPTGFVSDHISRKLSIILGTIIYIISMLIFALYPNFTFLIVAQLLFGISETLISGSDQALFFDNFKYINCEKSYQYYLANLTFLSTIALCVSFSVGGIIYTYDKNGVFWLTALFMAISLFFLIPMKEYPYKKQKDNMTLSINMLLDKVKDIGKESKRFKFYLFYCSLINAMILSVYLYFIPIVLENVNIDTIYFGIIFAICTVLFGLGAKLSKFIKEPSKGLLITLSVIVGIFSLHVFSKTVVSALIVVAGFRAMWGLFDIIFKTNLNLELNNSDIRATVFSVSNSLINIFSTIMISFFGGILTYFSFDILLYVIVGIFSLLLLLQIRFQ